MILKRRYKKFYDKFISLKGDPKKNAFALAIGIFIGVTPTIPFHTVMIFAVTFLLRQNFTAAYLGSWFIFNPITIPFFYMLEYELGKYVLGSGTCDIDFTSLSSWNMMEMGTTICYPLLLGGIILAPIIAIPAYFIACKAFRAIREKTCHD